MPPEVSNSKINSPKTQSGIQLLYRFLAGVALGVFLISIPVLFAWPIDLSLIQIGAASSLVIFCGILSSLWGEQFITGVMQVLEGFGS